MHPFQPSHLTFAAPFLLSTQPKRKSPSKITAQIPSPLLPLALSALLIPTPLSAKTPLSENTIFRRYIATDSDAILRYSLPLPSEIRGEEPVIRKLQQLLEKLGVDLRARGAAGLISGRRDLYKVRQILQQQQLDVLLEVSGKKRGKVAQVLGELDRVLSDIEDELGFDASVDGGSVFPKEMVMVGEGLRDALVKRNDMSKKSNFDAGLVDGLRREALDYIAEIEVLAVGENGLPYRIPRRYSNYPRLEGRALVEMIVEKKNGEWKDKKGQRIGKQVSMYATLDGYSAPITAGNFIDLIRRGYYDNTRVLTSERDFFAQLGEREDDDIEGFRDPSSGKRRQIPMEILVAGESIPSYGGTLDELGIGDLQPALPVSGYGALAMVHSVENANDASTQFYVFVLDPTSYSARSFGGNILTGSVATFGYVTKGREFLSQMQKDDRLVNATVVQGLENFKRADERSYDITPEG